MFSAKLQILLHRTPPIAGLIANYVLQYAMRTPQFLII